MLLGNSDFNWLRLSVTHAILAGKNGKNMKEYEYIYTKYFW